MSAPPASTASRLSTTARASSVPAPFHAICCQGERLELHAARAIHWPARRTIFVADVHLGKEEAFGRRGVPVPRGSSESDLQRLARLTATTAAERLCVLGDFMHDAPRAGEQWLGALEHFLDSHAELSVEVVAGNHDRVAGRPLIDPRVHWHETSVIDGPFVLRHEPGKDPAGFVLAGHIHPAYRLAGGRKQRVIRAPVFWFREDYAVLPAFGSFTGGETIKPAETDAVYMVGPDCVVPV